MSLRERPYTRLHKLLNLQNMAKNQGQYRHDYKYQEESYVYSVLQSKSEMVQYLGSLDDPNFLLQRADIVLSTFENEL